MATATDFFAAHLRVVVAVDDEQQRQATRNRDRVAASLGDSEHDLACRHAHELWRLLLWPPKVPSLSVAEAEATERAIVDALCGLVGRADTDAEEAEVDNKLGALKTPRPSATLTLVK